MSNLFKRRPERLLEMINNIPDERIRAHFRASAWWHWRGAPEGAALIAGGRDMLQHLGQYATADEFADWAKRIGWPASVVKQKAQTIEAADRAAYRVRFLTEVSRFYNDAARKRISRARRVNSMRGNKRNVDMNEVI